ncbi:hypothetical protein BDV93DRAFT_507794 [Ceratobasidium sp. AG-I]|nr:hypothetical protein BDV93DRAFT_507794 [Ceratobasidium sp. AG-I]
MKKGTRFLKHFHLPFRSRSPAQPPPSSTDDHGQSRAKNTAWAALKTSIGLLKESADAFGPLKSAIGGISRCIEIFERVAKSRKDYETLAIELDTICKDLSGYLSGPMPPTMTSSIESLAKGIEQEIAFVLEKEQRNRLERAVEAMDDPEEVMQCYSRIQRLLERLVY